VGRNSCVVEMRMLLGTTAELEMCLAEPMMTKKGRASELSSLGLFLHIQVILVVSRTEQ
jgi:hypothetical protein